MEIRRCVPQESRVANHLLSFKYLLCGVLGHFWFEHSEKNKNAITNGQAFAGSLLERPTVNMVILPSKRPEIFIHVSF